MDAEDGIEPRRLGYEPECDTSHITTAQNLVRLSGFEPELRTS